MKARRNAPFPFNPRSLARMGPRKLAALLLAVLLALGYSFFEHRTGDNLQGTVVRVVDGDTVIVNVDGAERRVRLIGVDTPETVHPDKPVQRGGKEASAFTKKNLLNRHVWLEYDAAPLDKYQRHLAYLWLGEPERSEAAIRERMFNARLLLEGYGRVITIQPNSRYAELFAEFQQEAHAAKRGLWR